MEEASMLRALQNVDNIVQLIGFYIDEDKMYIVQNLARGGDVLDRLLRQQQQQQRRQQDYCNNDNDNNNNDDGIVSRCSSDNKMYDEIDACKLMHVLLKTVQKLHVEYNMAHLDIKPENLLLQDPGDVTSLQLCDFGYASYLPSDGESLTKPCGTSKFIAPEIIDQGKYREEVDMWSIGCTLYMLLGGHQPFAGENEIEIMINIVNCNYDFNRPVWNRISAEAKELISNLLVVDPKGRWTATQALNCKWFRKDQLLEPQSNSNIETSAPVSTINRLLHNISLITDEMESTPRESTNINIDTSKAVNSIGSSLEGLQTSDNTVKATVKTMKNINKDIREGNTIRKITNDNIGGLDSPSMHRIKAAFKKTSKRSSFNNTTPKKSHKSKITPSKSNSSTSSSSSSGDEKRRSGGGGLDSSLHRIKAAFKKNSSTPNSSSSLQRTKSSGLDGSLHRLRAAFKASSKSKNSSSTDDSGKKNTKREDSMDSSSLHRIRAAVSGFRNARRASAGLSKENSFRGKMSRDNSFRGGKMSRDNSLRGLLSRDNSRSKIMARVTGGVGIRNRNNNMRNVADVSMTDIASDSETFADFCEREEQDELLL